MNRSAFPRLVLGLSLAVMLGLGASSSPPEDAPRQASGEIVTAVSATHTVQVKYLDTEGDYRRAEISIAPIRQGARAPWRGDLQAVHVAGMKPLSLREANRFGEAGFKQTAEFLSSGHSGRILMPAPRNLKRIWLRGERGSMVSFRIWTRDHNPSAYSDDDTDGGDKPAEPEPGDDGDGGDDDGGDDDDKTCTGAGSCVGIFNPWTCTCESDIVDPWGGQSQFDNAGGTFSF